MNSRNFLHRIGAAALFTASALLSASALTGCSSDADTPTPDPIPEGMARVNLSFSMPNLNNTRAGETYVNVTDAEKKVKDMWVYFFRKNDAGQWVKWNHFNMESASYAGATFTSLTDINKASNLQQGTNPGTGDYTTIIKDLNIPSGEYHVYVLANINQLLATGNSIKPDYTFTESEFQQFILSFDKSATDFSEALPMAADKTELTISKGASDKSKYDASTGTLTVADGSLTIKADMTILCSKVRYTVLFDNTAPTTVDGKEVVGFSFPYKSFAFSDLEIANVNKTEPLFASYKPSTILKQNDALNLKSVNKRVSFPSALDNADGLTASTANTTDGQIANQGTFYVVENLSSANDEKTYLNFKAKVDGQDKTYKIVLPQVSNPVGETSADVLKRGNYYDIIGKVTSSGMAFYVKVRPWIVAPRDEFPL